MEAIPIQPRRGAALVLLMLLVGSAPFPALAQTPAPAVLLAEDFDDGVANGWALQGLWSVSDWCGTPPSAPFYLGHQDKACNYRSPIAGGLDAYASVTLDLTGQTTVDLTFQHWLDPAEDTMHQVRARPLGATAWTLLAQWPDAGAPRLWQQGRVDLDAFAGARIQLQFFQQSVPNAYDFDLPIGWLLDDVRVTGAASRRPIADAGPDQMLVDADGDGFALVRLDGANSTDPEGAPLRHAWSWSGGSLGEGAVALARLPTGNHSVRLVVTDAAGIQAEDKLLVRIDRNRLPVAEAGPALRVGDADGDDREEVLLDGARSFDLDGALVAYRWLDGATLLATGPQASVTLPVGARTLTLEVVDGGNATARDDVAVTVAPNAPPVADAGPALQTWHTSGAPTATVRLDGGASRDPDGPLARHEWRHNGPLVSTRAVANLTLPLGRHLIGLAVQDAAGRWGFDNVTVDVVASAPALPMANAGPDRLVSDGDGDGMVLVDLDGRASKSDGGNLTRHAWYAEDSLVAVGAQASVALPLGTHDFLLLVEDHEGGTDLDAVRVTVAPNRPPDPDFTFFACDLTHCSFQATAIDPEGNPVTFTWEWPDGTTSTGAYANHLFPDFSTYNVCVVASDGLASRRVCHPVLLERALYFTEFNGVGPEWTFSGLWHLDDHWCWSTSGDAYLGYHRPDREHVYEMDLPRCYYDTGGRTSGVAELEADDLWGALDVVLLRFSEFKNAGGGFVCIPEDPCGSGDAVTLTQAWNGTWRDLPEVLDVPLGGPFSHKGYDLTGRLAGSAIDIRFSFDGTDAPQPDPSWDPSVRTGWYLDDLCICTSRNYPPIPNAGPDQARDDADRDGLERFNVQGSARDIRGQVVAWRWELGDQTLAATQNATLALPPGEHRVRLVVTDDKGAQDIDEITLTVRPVGPPVAHAGPPIVAHDGDGDGFANVTLDASASYDPRGGAIRDVTWLLEDAPLATGTRAVARLPVGEHLVTLRVATASFAATDTLAVRVLANQAPSADAGLDLEARDVDGDGWADVALDGTGSGDVDGRIVERAWTSEGALLAADGFARVTLPVGAHVVRLDVRDDAGLASHDDVRITVHANRAPLADAGPDQHVFDRDRDGRALVTLVGDATDPDGTPLTYAWLEDAATLSTAPSFSRMFDVGRHEITLRVRDAGGAFAEDRVVVNVSDDLPPSVALAIRCDGLACALDANGTRDPEGKPLTFTWAFGDGVTRQTDVGLVQHTYPTHAPRLACLTVEDGANANQTCTQARPLATLLRETFDDGAADGWSLEALWRVSDSCGRESDRVLAYQQPETCVLVPLVRETHAARLDIDLTGHQAATLRFDSKAEASETKLLVADHHLVEARADDGAWQRVWWWSNQPGRPGWTHEEVNLDAYAGKPVELRFRYDGDAATADPPDEGWLVDDVQVLAG